MVAAVVMVAADATVTEPFPRPRSLVVRPVHAASQSKNTTTKNVAKTPQINKRNRLPLSALRCHRDRLSTTILAPFLAVENEPVRRLEAQVN